MLVHVYQAALYCEECGDKIREDLTDEGKAPADPDDDDEIVCKFCKKSAPLKDAHRHQGEYVGDACCWDERLRSSE